MFSLYNLSLVIKWTKLLPPYLYSICHDHIIIFMFIRNTSPIIFITSSQVFRQDPPGSSGSEVGEKAVEQVATHFTFVDQILPMDQILPTQSHSSAKGKSFSLHFILSMHQLWIDCNARHILLWTRYYLRNHMGLSHIPVQIGPKVNRFLDILYFPCTNKYNQDICEVVLVTSHNILCTSWLVTCAIFQTTNCISLL